MGNEKDKRIDVKTKHNIQGRKEARHVRGREKIKNKQDKQKQVKKENKKKIEIEQDIRFVNREIHTRGKIKE